MTGDRKSTSRGTDPQLSLDFQAPKCWLVCHDRVRNFHYVVEGEIRSHGKDGKVTVHTERDVIVTLPPERVYPTKQAAVARQLECDRETVVWRRC